MYSFEALSKFIEMITAPESNSQLEILVTDYAEEVIESDTLSTALNNFSSRRGYSLSICPYHELTVMTVMITTMIKLHPHSLVTGRM